MMAVAGGVPRERSGAFIQPPVPHQPVARIHRRKVQPDIDGRARGIPFFELVNAGREMVQPRVGGIGTAGVEQAAEVAGYLATLR